MGKNIVQLGTRAAQAGAVALYILAGNPASAVGKYTRIDPQGSKYTSPTGINRPGAIAGTYSDASSLLHGFVRTGDGTITSFDPTGSSGTFPTAIDDGGAIAGYCSDASHVTHGFLRKPDGTIKSF
ncbi:MAG TPA: hypothetical protein VG274_10405, partial [Rhizomicrobium sp.]|nr:hypothetical protein [Rhizomicrobium sp.]